MRYLKPHSLVYHLFNQTPYHNKISALKRDLQFAYVKNLLYQPVCVICVTL